MNDLISRQAAKLKVARVIWEDGDSCYDFHDKCIDCLDDLPSAQPEQRWIPCSERLPKESGTYTVTAYDGATNRVTYAKYQKRLKRWELTGARAYWRVLAWCPPPEPYKEDDNEG